MSEHDAFDLQLGAVAAAPATDVGPSSLANRWWRIAATGICFACFGIGGLLLGLVVFPLFLCAVRCRVRRSSQAREVIHHLFRAFVAMMCVLGVCRLEVRGRERLRRDGLLILANHPSLIDVVFLMSLVRNSDCIVKAALLRNPFTRGPVRAAGFVCNDSGPGLVEDCIAAVRGELAITPVRITCKPRMLGKADKWWRVPPRAGHFVIEVGDDIPATYPDHDGAQALAARRLTEELARHLGVETLHATA